MERWAERQEVVSVQWLAHALRRQWKWVATGVAAGRRAGAGDCAVWRATLRGRGEDSGGDPNRDGAGRGRDARRAGGRRQPRPQHPSRGPHGAPAAGKGTARRRHRRATSRLRQTVPRDARAQHEHRSRSRRPTPPPTARSDWRNSGRRTTLEHVRALYEQNPTALSREAQPRAGQPGAAPANAEPAPHRLPQAPPDGRPRTRS
jgi:hypothetical protein